MGLVPINLIQEIEKVGSMRTVGEVTPHLDVDRSGRAEDDSYNQPSHQEERGLEEDADAEPADEKESAAPGPDVTVDCFV